MSLQLQSVRWKNFISAGNQWLTVPLARNEITLIVGKNGQGKSQLLDAICFGLYGKAFRKVTKTQLVNSVNKKDAVVEIAFRRNGSQYVVRRGIKPNIFEIYKDKQLIDQSSANIDYQEHLEQQILGITYKTFCQVNILGVATYTSFMLLPAAHRREVVEDLLDSQVYTSMAVMLKEKHKQLLGRLNALQTQQAVAKAELNAQHSLVERQNQFDDQQIKQANDQIQQITAEMEQYVESYTDLETQITHLKQQITSIAADPQVLKNASIKLQSEIATANSEIALLKRQTAGVASDVCNVCGQQIDQDHKQHVNEQAESQIEKLTKDCATATARYDKVVSVLNQLSELDRQMFSLQTRLSTQKHQWSSLQTAKAAAIAQLEQLQQQTHVQADMQALAAAQAKFDKLKQTYDTIATQVELQKKTLPWLSDSGLRSKAISKYVPKINELLNSYLQQMDQFIQFELNEQFEETIKARYRDVFSYNSFSEGEKKRIDLALLLTWRAISKLRNSVSTNLLIFDEVLDSSMDEDGVADFMKIAGQLGGAQNTIIISHNQSVIDKFSNVLVAKKDGHFTQLKEYSNADSIG